MHAAIPGSGRCTHHNQHTIRYKTSNEEEKEMKTRQPSMAWRGVAWRTVVVASCVDRVLGIRSEAVATRTIQQLQPNTAAFLFAALRFWFVGIIDHVLVMIGKRVEGKQARV
jgi:hypothetical protein